MNDDDLFNYYPIPQSAFTDNERGERGERKKHSLNTSGGVSSSSHSNATSKNRYFITLNNPNRLHSPNLITLITLKIRLLQTIDIVHML